MGIMWGFLRDPPPTSIYVTSGFLPTSHSQKMSCDDVLHSGDRGSGSSSCSKIAQSLLVRFHAACGGIWRNVEKLTWLESFPGPRTSGGTKQLYAELLPRLGIS